MKLTSIVSVQPPFFDEKSTEMNNRSIESGMNLLEFSLRKGAKVTCLPEFFNVFGVEQKAMRETCANWERLLTRTCGLARRYTAFIILPMMVQESNSFFNRAYLIDSTGSVIDFYDKVHPTIAEREQLSISAGDQIRIFETPLGRIGLAICYDFYFPEYFSTLRQLKPDIIFMPSLQRSDHEMANEAMLKTRAIDMQAYIVRSSFGRQIDLPWKPGMMFGQSCIVHPDGTILANAGHYEGIAMAHVRLPFEWKRPRCGGYPEAPVREFLDEDRRDDLYKI